MGSYASYAVRDAGGNIIGYQSAYTGQVTYEGGNTAQNARTVDTPQYVASQNTAAQIAQMVGKSGNVDSTLARVAATEGYTQPVTQQQRDVSSDLPKPFISNTNQTSTQSPETATTTPTFQSVTQARPGYYASTELGDSITQARARELMNQTNRPFGSYDDAVRYVLEEQRQSATNSTAKRFYTNELSKAIEQPVEAASEYHYLAKESGRPQAANPYEYQADLAVELLKGAPTRSTEEFSPVSGEMAKYLPGGKEGVQQYQWNTALGKNEVVNFMPGLAALQAAESKEGPYGALYGGTGAESITPENVNRVLSAWQTSVPQSAAVVTAMPYRVSATGPDITVRSSDMNTPNVSEFGGLPKPFRSTSSDIETLGVAYVVPGSLAMFSKGSGDTVPIAPNSYKIETTTTESEPSVQNFLMNAGGYVWNTARWLVRGFGVDLPRADVTAGLAKTTQTPSYDISLPSPYVSHPPSSEPTTKVTYSGGSPEITALGKWIDTNRPTLDLTNETAVNQFNANVDKYNAMSAANPVIQTTTVTPGYKPSDIIFHVTGPTTTITEPTIKESIQEQTRSYIPQSVKDWYNSPTKESGNFFVSGESGSFGIGTDYTNAFLKGVAKETLENPLDVAGTTAFATLLTGGLGKLGQVATPILSKSPILEGVSKAIPYVVGGVATYGTAEEATSGFKDYTPKAAEKGGEIFAQSWLPFIVGGSLYSKAEALDVAGKPLPSVKDVVGKVYESPLVKSVKEFDVLKYADVARSEVLGNLPTYKQYTELSVLPEVLGTRGGKEISYGEDIMGREPEDVMGAYSGDIMGRSIEYPAGADIYGNPIPPYDIGVSGKLLEYTKSPSTKTLEYYPAEQTKLMSYLNKFTGASNIFKTQVGEISVFPESSAMSRYTTPENTFAGQPKVGKSWSERNLKIGDVWKRWQIPTNVLSGRGIGEQYTGENIRPPGEIYGGISSTRAGRGFNKATTAIGSYLEPIVGNLKGSIMGGKSHAWDIKTPLETTKKSEFVQIPGTKAFKLKGRTEAEKAQERINYGGVGGIGGTGGLPKTTRTSGGDLFLSGLGSKTKFEGISKEDLSGMTYRHLAPASTRRARLIESEETEYVRKTIPGMKRPEPSSKITELPIPVIESVPKLGVLSIPVVDQLSKNVQSMVSLQSIKNIQEQVTSTIQKQSIKQSQNHVPLTKGISDTIEKSLQNIVNAPSVETIQTPEVKQTQETKQESKQEQIPGLIVTQIPIITTIPKTDITQLTDITQRPGVTQKPEITQKPKIEPKIPVIPLLGGGGFGGGGGGSDKRRRYKRHEEIFSYNFDPWKAARITAKALAVGSNVTRGPKSSLPTSIFAQKQSVAVPKVSHQKKVAPLVATPKKAPVPKIVVPKFNMPVQKSPQFAMPKIGVSKSTNAMKPISLPSSLPTKKKKVKK